MSGYTPLEKAVMEALAWDLAEAAPDLPGQFARGRFGRRRNTGFGLFTEMDAPARSAATGLTGDYGTVHAMVGSLRDPIAFKARLRQGLLIGIVGDSYGQDTRGVDFDRAPFDQVFTVDEQGTSVPFEYARPAEPAPARRPEPARPSRPAPAAATAQPSKPALARAAPPAPGASLSAPEAAQILIKAVAAPYPEDAPSREDRVSLLVGAWAWLAAMAFIAVIAFDMSLVSAGVLLLVGGRLIHSRQGQRTMRRVMAIWTRLSSDLDSARRTSGAGQ